MLAKSVNAGALLLSGICFIILGICLFFANQVTLKILLLLFGLLTILSSTYSFFKILLKKDSNKKIKFSLLLPTIRDFIIGIIICLFYRFILYSFAVCFGIYLLLHVIINCISYYLYYKNKIKGRLKLLFSILFQIFFFIPLFFDTTQNIQMTSIILGIYLIGYGITQITDFFTILIPTRTTNRIKQQIQIPLPVIFNAFIPRKLIELVNDALEVIPEKEELSIQKRNEKPDIFVLIHLANSGTAAMGHVEIAFEDTIYSYGNYDMHSRSLFNAIGDGVVLTANKQNYIRYIVTEKKRYIVEFGLSLTKKEKEEVKKRLQKLITENTEPYYSDLELSDKGLLPGNDYHDMSSEIYKCASGKFYKIIKGKYKKFFVLKTNCAMVANFVLGSIGKQILCINGIITPGSYYDYLNNRFKLKNTNVITRKVYTKNDFKEEGESK